MEGIQDAYVRNYIANINTELQTKILEIISLKAQLQLANDNIAELKKELSSLEPVDTEDKKKK
jgi:hypothetical protein